MVTISLKLFSKEKEEDASSETSSVEEDY